MQLSDIETSRLYAFEKGGPTRLEVRWKASFRELRVLVDGELVGTLEKKKMPREGSTLKLPDGSTLCVRLSGILGIELRRDGVHLPGSDLDPRRVLRNASYLMVAAALIDAAVDVVLYERGRIGTLPLALDAALLLCAVPTFLGSRMGLAIGIGAFASRFGLDRERSPTMLIYGVVATWIFATHFFATFKRRR